MAYGDQDQGSNAFSFLGPPMSAAMSQNDPAMMQAFRDAIAKIESAGSGDYNAVGPKTSSGDQAYGRYQVMGANIPQWTQQALGKSMTTQQFLADPSAQDAVFNHQWGQNLSKYGNANDAASVWFTGHPLSKGANLSDVNGVTGSKYVDNFNRALSGLSAMKAYQNVAGGGNTSTDGNSDLPSPGATQVSNPTGQSGFAVPQQPESMWDKFREGGPGALFGMPTTRPGGWDLGSALQQAAISGMAITNPQGASAMAQIPAMEARMQQPKYSVSNFQPQNGSYVRINNRTGEVTPGNLTSQGYTPFQAMPEGEWDKFQNRNSTINELNTNYGMVNQIRDDILNKRLDLSHLSEWKGDILAGLNDSDPNTRAQANWAHYQSLLAGANQRMQHGTQTDADLALAQNSVIPHGKENDNAAVLTSLENVQRAQQAHLNSLIVSQQGDVGKFGTGHGNQLQPGPWDDPSHYGNMLKSAQDYETNYAPRRDAFLKEWDAGRGTPGVPVNASTRPAGSTSSTGGSLLNNGQPIDPAKAPEYLKGMPSGTTFNGVDGKMYRIP